MVNFVDDDTPITAYDFDLEDRNRWEHHEDMPNVERRKDN